MNKTVDELQKYFLALILYFSRRILFHILLFICFLAFLAWVLKNYSLVRTTNDYHNFIHVNETLH